MVRWIVLFCFCLQSVFTQRFEVASIKPYPNDPIIITSESGVRHEARPARASVDIMPGRHEVRGCMTVSTLIQMLYHTPTFVLDKATEPRDSWIYDDWWSIDAKSAIPLNNNSLSVMLANLLVDRFKLRTEVVKQQGVYYEVTVDSQRLKLVENNDPDAPSKISFEVPGMTDSRIFRLVISAATMHQLLFSVPFQELGAPIHDLTGLNGKYDATWRLSTPYNTDFFLRPDIVIKTCRQELGLIISKKEGLIDVLTVLHVEKPSEN